MGPWLSQRTDKAVSAVGGEAADGYVRVTEVTLTFRAGEEWVEVLCEDEGGGG